MCPRINVFHLLTNNHASLMSTENHLLKVPKNSVGFMNVGIVLNYVMVYNLWWILSMPMPYITQKW